MSCIGIAVRRSMPCIGISVRRSTPRIGISAYRRETSTVLGATLIKSALNIRASKVCSTSRGVELYAFDEIRLYANDVALYGDVN